MTNTTKKTTQPKPAKKRSYSVVLWDTLGKQECGKFGFQAACLKGRTPIEFAWEMVGHLYHVDRYTTLKVS